MGVESKTTAIHLRDAICNFEKATSKLTGDQAALAEATKNALKVFEAEIVNIVKRLG